MNEQQLTTYKPKYLKSKEACEFFGVKESTLRKWEQRKLINVIRTNTSAGNGHRRYDINSYGKLQQIQSIQQIEQKTDDSCKGQKKVICYCRVSSRHQKDDLERQVKFMQNKYPEAEIIKDIGSGINFKRPGLLKLITEAIAGNIKEVVVAHRDRLCRFGFDLIEFIFQQYKVRLLVLDQSDNKTSEQELAEDLLSIIHIFSSKANGRRKYKIINTKKENENEQEKKASK